MKKGMIVNIVLGGIALLAAVGLIILVLSPSVVVVPPQAVAVVVPVVDIIPDVPEVVFIGISSVSPLDISEGQSVTNNIVVTFDEAISPASVNADTFTIRGPNGVNLKGIISSDESRRIWTFNPTDYLDSRTLYDLTITTGVVGVSGNSLIENFEWSFTTKSVSSGGGGSSAAPEPEPEPEPEAPLVLTTINLTPSTNVLNLLITSKTRQLVAQGFDQNGISMNATINYTSNNTAVAIVNASGFVTAISSGMATITATSGAITNTSTIIVASSAINCPVVSVNLGTAGDFAILTKSGITTTGATSIIGDMGTSPIASTAITGFDLVMDASNTFSTSALVSGNIYAPDYADPTPAKLTTAVSDMETAYTTAAGLADCVTELGAGNIGGMTLASGSYAWGTDLLIPTDVTLFGDSNDVWVFEVAGGLTVSSAKQVRLSGGALPENVYWVVAQGATLGTTSVVNGNILNLGSLAEVNPIALNTGAVLNGRALSQKAVTLDANTVTKPN